MKKSELTQLTQIIEHLVAREVRKQLPSIIAETFQNMMGKSVVTERIAEIQPIQEEVELQENKIGEEPSDFKASLRELFAGTPVMRTPAPPEQVRQPRKYAKDPILNQILNETKSDLRDRERLVGAAAFQGGYSPSLNMVPGFNPDVASIPISTPPPLIEGQVSNHAPMAALPEGTSVLDLKQHAPAAVKGALTRNYSQMMKLIDKKRGKI